jgi:KaiC/GvpD/RAD55 family RecA-like ATPase
MVDLNSKCPTGIPGLDELLGGGFPRARSILLSGSCGTGKTTFAVQFLYNGVVQYNEPGIMISLEQDPKELKQDMMSFGFDLSKLEREGKLAIVDTSISRVGLASLGGSSDSDDSIGLPEGSMSLLPDEFNIKKILEIVVDKAEKIGAKRIVFDSIPALDFLIRDHGDMKYAVRQVLLALNYRLKMAGLTTLLITETAEDGALSAHGVESYVADGAILLSINEALDNRTMKIRKMRQTVHSLKPRTIEFTSQGVAVKGASGVKKKLF